MALNSPDLSPLDNVWGVVHQWVYQMQLTCVGELKKQLVDVWSRTLSTLLSMNEECTRISVFTQTANM